ncbi:hypothetical protein ACFQ61_02160 [Streptomyces sp. NPDC056500]|uniref:DUF7426 family protein n=1 Tax=Streptomyces sp. NPDC056500 TaxID=3345840 RepID=UPI0036AF11CE
MSGKGFEALSEFLDDFLELPVTGTDGVERIYRIEDPSAEDGVKIERITTLAARMAMGGAEPTAPALNDEEEIDLYRMCLGGAYDALEAEVSWSRFKHVALTAMLWITADRETAQTYWSTGNTPGKANRATRRQAKRDSASGAAGTTKPRASSSGTKTSPRKAKRARQT